MAKRALLESLTTRDLLALAKACGIPLVARAPRDVIVATLARSRRSSLAEALSDLASKVPAAPRETRRAGGRKLGIVGVEACYQAGDLTFKGYLSQPRELVGRHASVIVAPEWWGCNDFVREKADALAKLGYVALAIDLYGNGKKARSRAEAEHLAWDLLGNPAQCEERFAAAHAFLLAQPNVQKKRIAAIGYCFGGAVALHMARVAFPLKAVVAFHATLTAFVQGKKGHVAAKILVLHGDEDTLVGQEQLIAFRQEMKALDADFRVVTYRGAAHSFTNPTADLHAKRHRLPLAYHPSATKRSWNEMRRFLSQVL